MKFIADSAAEVEELRTKFYKLDTDVQLAIEELDHTLAILGYQVVVMYASNKILKIEVWILK